MTNYLDTQIDLTGDAELNPAWPENERPLNWIEKIVVHHDAQFEPTNYSDQPRYDAEALYQNGHSIPGSMGIQYHYHIDNVGTISKLRPLTTFLWHCGDLAVNQHSVAVCLDGDFQTGNQEPTREQFESLQQLLDYLATPASGDFPATQADVYPHRAFSSTNCCGDNLVPFVDEYRTTNGAPQIPAVAVYEPADLPAAGLTSPAPVSPDASPTVVDAATAPVSPVVPADPLPAVATAPDAASSASPSPAPSVVPDPSPAPLTPSIISVNKDKSVKKVNLHQVITVGTWVVVVVGALVGYLSSTQTVTILGLLTALAAAIQHSNNVNN